MRGHAAPSRRWLPRDPAQRTAEDWAQIDLGGLGLRLVAFGLCLGTAAGFVLGWLVFQ